MRAEMRSVVALNQQRGAAGVADVASPVECFVQRSKFLEQLTILLQGSNLFLPRRSAVNSEHVGLLKQTCVKAAEPPALTPEALPFQTIQLLGLSGHKENAGALAEVP